MGRACAGLAEQLASLRDAASNVPRLIPECLMPFPSEHVLTISNDPIVS